MAVGRLARLAGRVPVPIYLAVGAGARAAVDDLRANPAVQIVDSPRHATVLLIAGVIPRSLVRPLARVHDQLSHPRATVWWSGPGPITDLELPDAVRAQPDDDIAERLVTLHRQLMTGDRASEVDVLPDEPPNEWRGVGPNGQGGEGMMGGIPYGRPMAMTADDRDGLALDPLSFTWGPFLPFMPPGLQLDVNMQGDVLTEVEVGPNPFTEEGLLGTPITQNLPAVQPGPIGHAQHRLRYLARILDVHGLRALAIRAYRMAAGLTPDSGPEIRRLSRRLHRTTALRWSTEGVGAVAATSLPPELAALRGDAWHRWRRALDDAETAVAVADHQPTARHPLGELPAAADDTAWDGPLTGSESWPGGDHPALELLPELLQGMELGAAVTTIVSLDVQRGIPRAATLAGYP